MRSDSFPDDVKDGVSPVGGADVCIRSDEFDVGVEFGSAPPLNEFSTVVAEFPCLCEEVPTSFPDAVCWFSDDVGVFGTDCD